MLFDLTFNSLITIATVIMTVVIMLPIIGVIIYRDRCLECNQIFTKKTIKTVTHPPTNPPRKMIFFGREKREKIYRHGELWHAYTYECTRCGNANEEIYRDGDPHTRECTRCRHTPEKTYRDGDPFKTHTRECTKCGYTYDREITWSSD